MINLIAGYLTAFFEALMFYQLYGTFCRKKEGVPGYAYILAWIGLSLVIIFINSLYLQTALNVVLMIISAFVMSFMYNGELALKALIASCGIALGAAIELSMLFIITSIYNVSVNVAVTNDVLLLFGIILSKMLAFAAVNIICMVAKRKMLKLGVAYWGMFFLMFLNSALSVYLLFRMAYETEITYLNPLMMLCSFGLFLSCFFSFYMCEHMAKQNDIIAAQSQYEQQIKAQSKHLDEILLTQDQLRKFRHDLSQHLTALSGYFSNGDSKGGLEYIDRLTDIAMNDSYRIKTGNTAFDAIVNTKIKLAESKGITFNSDIQIPLGLGMSATDICIIFGNALDNAIEACERIVCGEKYISFFVEYSANSLMCRIINPCEQKAGHTLFTSKPDKLNHGFGLGNIRTALDAYGGIMEISQDDDCFELKLMMFVNGENSTEQN